MLNLKRCSQCKQWKSLSEFSRNKKESDGLRYSCKQCDREYNNKKYASSETHRTTLIEVAKVWRKNNKHKANQHQRKWLHSSKGRAFLDRNKQRLRAKKVVSDATRKGLLPKVSTIKCKKCSEYAQEYHHYNGYEPQHYLDVIPLCRKCHRIVHNR